MYNDLYIKARTNQSSDINVDSHIIGGDFIEAHQIDQFKNRITRLNTDGSIDNTFNIGTGFNNIVRTTELQPDGKTLVGGDFTTYNGTTRSRITRLNTDGSIDGTFNIGTGFGSAVRSISLQSDGKILVGGDFTTYNGNNRSRITRLNTDGSIDGTFDIGTGFNGSILSIVIQPDGKILVGGDFTAYNGTTRNRIIRLNTDGSIDGTFDIGTGFNTDGVRSIYSQTDGKILVGGSFTAYNGTTRNRIIRLNTDGSIDGTFDIGTGFNNNVSRINIQPDGKVLVGGIFTSYNGTTRNRIIRLNTDGSIDGTFNIGTGFNGDASVIWVQSDGKILVGGSFTTYNENGRNFIARLNTDGSIDNTFNIGTGFNLGVSTVFLQPDGKVLVGGNFNFYNRLTAAVSQTRNRIIQYNKNGDIRYDVVGLGTGLNGSVKVIIFQSDGKTLVGGDFTNYQISTFLANRIVRLNPDGSIDVTFNTGAAFESIVQTMCIQSDGKILVGGNFTSYNGTTRNKIIRLNTDGSIDNTFNIGTGVSGNVFSIVIQPDGKILVGGTFTAYNGTTRNNIIRLNTDGSIDNTFNIGTGFNTTTRTLVIQPDGKILVGGDFIAYNGSLRNNIIRLNTDGSIDNTFNIGTGFNNRVWTLSIQSDGKILAGGEFDTYNGNGRNFIVRLNTDGSIDNTFNIGTGFNNNIFTINIQSNSKILVGGAFTTYNGDFKSRIARLNADGSIDNTYLGITNNVVNSIAIIE
jgi:uncharacterized delta-60 repeat protein